MFGLPFLGRGGFWPSTQKSELCVTVGVHLVVVVGGDPSQFQFPFFLASLVVPLASAHTPLFPMGFLGTRLDIVKVFFLIFVLVCSSMFLPSKATRSARNFSHWVRFRHRSSRGSWRFIGSFSGGMGLSWASYRSCKVLPSGFFWSLMLIPSPSESFSNPIWIRNGVRNDAPSILRVMASGSPAKT